MRVGAPGLQACDQVLKVVTVEVADRGFTLSGHAASLGTGTEVADRGFTFGGHAASHEDGAEAAEVAEVERFRLRKWREQMAWRMRKRQRVA